MNRTKSTIVLLAGVGAPLLAALLWSSSAIATDPQPAGAAEIPGQLAALNDKFDRLLEAMDLFRQNQETDLLIRRIELEQRRIAPLDNELRKAQAEARETEQQIEQGEQMLEEEREGLRDLVDADEQEVMREQLDEWQRHLERERGRLESIHDRVRRLEDDLSDARETIDDLDARLLERLDR